MKQIPVEQNFSECKELTLDKELIKSIVTIAYNGCNITAFDNNTVKALEVMEKIGFMTKETTRRLKIKYYLLLKKEFNSSCNSESLCPKGIDIKEWVKKDNWKLNPVSNKLVFSPVFGKGIELIDTKTFFTKISNLLDREKITKEEYETLRHYTVEQIRIYLRTYNYSQEEIEQLPIKPTSSFTKIAKSITSTGHQKTREQMENENVKASTEIEI